MRMIKVDILDVQGFEPAIRGMRNPKNSWNKSDSDFVAWDDFDFTIGDNDLDLMQRLFKAGVEHRTYARMIEVWMDIEAPLYWWKEMDRYTVGKTQISTSTMHKLHDRPLMIDNFSHEHMDYLSERILDSVITTINDLMCSFFETGNESDWKQMIQLLPSSYNQKRTVMMSYETVFKIIKERSNHPLDEWNDFVEVLKNLPYVNEIMK